MISAISEVTSDYTKEDICDDVADGFYLNRSDVNWVNRTFAATVPSTTLT